MADTLDADYAAWRRQQARISRQSPDQQAMTHAGARPAPTPERRVPAPFRFMGERYELPVSLPESNAPQAESLSQMALPQGPGDLALAAVAGPMGRPLGALGRAALGGAGLSMDPERAEAMFMGLKARRPPMGALKQAEIMHQKGAPRPYIWEDERVYYGPDGHPRWELDDSRMALDPNALRLPRENARPRPLQDVLDHPELYEQYPHLGSDVSVEVRRLGGSQAEWNPEDKIISLSPMVNKPVSAISHEVQHAIQDFEGWNGGAAPVSMSQWLHMPHLTRMKELEISPGTPRPDLSPEAAREYRMLSREWRSGTEDARAFRDYERSAGETESRNTEARLTWDDWERGQTPPWSSASVAEPRQILHPRLSTMQKQYNDWYRNGIPQEERDRLIEYARSIAATDEPYKRKP
ncbi:MAG: hypothetical protein RLZZ524_1430 [Pseudomonadota bacterium]